MTENGLTQALCDFLAEIFTGNAYAMPTQSGELRAPKIVAGYLPPKRNPGSDDDFPFILVRPDSGQTQMDETTCTVSIIIGAYDDGVIEREAGKKPVIEARGYEWCLNVMERIKQKLIEMPNATLANRYQMRFPVRWNLYAEQPYPYWQLDMTTEWAYNSPAVTFGVDDFD